MTPSATIKVPAFQNILRYTADFIFDRFSQQSPDYSRLIVLLPHSQAAQQFNETLCRSLDTENSVIIPPWSGTLRTWINSCVHNHHADYPILNEYSRQLLFVEALQQHPDLFKEENQWQVAQALLSLFDELALNQTGIFSSAELWQKQLQQAYGIETQPEHLLNESRLVHTLWHAWQQQLSDHQLSDETADYISRLKNAAAVIDNRLHFICLQQSSYTLTEQDFIRSLLDREQCHVIEYAQTLVTSDIDKSDSVRDAPAFFTFITETFKQPLSEADTAPAEKNPAPRQQSIKQRARTYSEQLCGNESSALPFSTCLAPDEEQQIRAIDYYIRLNILDGKNNIAIISEDRKLSRRLRALLERSGVPIQDRAGWSLSTTQAATIIERWLQCIEEDFSAYPLLDCLKSPFIDITAATLGEQSTDDDFRKNIYRFEHDLVLHENISSNIDRYKATLRDRLKRLTHWPAKSYQQLMAILEHIQDTARPLSKIHADSMLDNKKIPVADFIETVHNSLQQLGIIHRYETDDAGLVLLKTFAALRQSTQYANPELSWHHCRVWLGMALEAQNFTPAAGNTRVQLMTLEQACCQQFDCLIIAACESQHFPGSAKNQPFFNQAVRAALGLQTWQIQRQQRHELFNRSLLSAADVLLTACNEEKGEEKAVSPWLELLISFYQLAFDKKPDNDRLRQLLQLNNEVVNCVDTELPGRSSRPSPAIPRQLIPERVSASSYQRIMNCPYQYFSADALALKPLEELSDELKKSDYGERVHLILQTFHNGHHRYGKAFQQPLTDVQRKPAEDYLNRLSEKIFLADLENNVLHRSWLYRWQKHIPSYINWQIQHEKDWSIYLSEKNIELPLNAGDENSVRIYGRLDRIDRARENSVHAIIDYKTGRSASQQDVDSGEEVQLGVYALLDDQATEVAYLSVDSSAQKVETRSRLCGEELQRNRSANRQRLSELFDQLQKQTALPAWGDDSVCRYCRFSGLCRRAQWSKK